MLLTVCLLGLLLADGCHRHGHGEDSEQAMLTLYVYMPDQPLLTRGDEGQVAPLTDESKVTQLQAWVFLNHGYTDVHGQSHSSGEPIGYLSVSVSAGWSGDSYQLPVSDEFAAAVNDNNENNRPTVDVYVLANGSTVGATLGANTTRTQLNSALMGTANFGTSSIVTAVPAGGLPMSGVLLNQGVYGQQPVLRIGNENSMATVALVRCVSKLRFVFSRLADNSHTIAINSLALDGDMVPTDQYLFLLGAWSAQNRFRVRPSYVAGETTLAEGTQQAPIGIGTAATKEVLLSYLWTSGQTAQQYEGLIDAGVTVQVLQQSGPYYLRESDRQLTGKIYYSVDGGETQSASFSMAAAGDFGRNHTWIVYGYFNDGDLLEVEMVYLKDWEDNVSTNVNDELYNW